MSSKRVRGARIDVTDESLLTGYGGRMLGSLALAWAVLQLGRFLLSPLLPAIIGDLGITTVTAGFVLGGFQAVYAIIQYPSGRLSDRFSRAALIVPGLAALTLGFLLFASAVSPLLFVGGALLLGVGKGLYAVPSRALLSDLFVERRGQALGLYAAGTDAGGVLASVAALVVTGTAAADLGPARGVVPTLPGLSWRAPFLPVAAALFLLGAVYVRWNRDGYELGRVEFGVGETVRRLSTTSAQREALVAFALFFFVVGAWVNFLPTYLAQGKGMSESLAAALFAVVFVVGVWAKPLAGLVSDRVPRRAVGVAGLSLAVVALSGVVLASTLWVVVGAIALFALGYKTLFPVADAVLLDAAPDDNTGGDLGAARALFLGVGALGPVYMGSVAAAADYAVAFAGLAVCLLASAGLLARGLLRARRTTPPA
nr:MFS transporter [Halorientalis sp.]